MAQNFRSAFTKEDLFLSTDVDVVAGTPIKIGEYTIPADVLVTLGYGYQSGQESAQGRIYIDFKSDADADMEGLVRLSVFNSQNQPLQILNEYRTQSLRTGATDRTKQIPFPEQLIAVSEDKKIVLEFISETTGKVNKANSTVLMDVSKTIL